MFTVLPSVPRFHPACIIFENPLWGCTRTLQQARAYWSHTTLVNLLILSRVMQYLRYFAIHTTCDMPNALYFHEISNDIQHLCISFKIFLSNKSIRIFSRKYCHLYSRVEKKNISKIQFQLYVANCSGINQCKAFSFMTKVAWLNMAALDIFYEASMTNNRKWAIPKLAIAQKAMSKVHQEHHFCSYIYNVTCRFHILDIISFLKI